MRPDAALFHQHIIDTGFQAGVDRGDWGLHDDSSDYTAWPVVFFWVRAASKPGKPGRYFFRFELSGYPGSAPTARPWDIVRSTPLDVNQWPRGNKLVSFTFNFGWNTTALYAPCDRIAMIGHDAWRTQFPDLWWQSSFKITIYLAFLHRLLNSSDYVNT